MRQPLRAVIPSSLIAVLASCGPKSGMLSDTDSADTSGEQTPTTGSASTDGSSSTGGEPTTTGDEPAASSSSSSSTEPDSGGGGGGGACPLSVPGDAPSGGENYRLAPSKRIDVASSLFFDVVIGDVSGDGRPDIVGAELDLAVLFVQGGNGSPGAPLEIPHGWQNPSYIDLLRVAPGDALVLASMGDSGTELFAALGDGVVDPTSVLPEHGGRHLRVVDLDLDGDDDLLWLVDESTLAYAHGDGAGGFGDPVVLPPGPLKLTGRFALGDLTGDQFADFVSVEYPGQPLLVVVPHDGVGGPSADGWLTFPLASPDVSGFDVGDVDGDGLADFVWQDHYEADYDVRTRVMRGLPGGGFAEPFEIAQHGWGGDVSIADVNKDGRNDVVVLHASGFAVSVVLGAADGLGPQKTTEFPTAASVAQYALAVGDVDCDGCPDVVAADVGGLDIFRGLDCAR